MAANQVSEDLPNSEPLWPDAAISRNGAICLCLFLVTSSLLKLFMLYGFWPKLADKGWAKEFGWFIWPSGLEIESSQRVVIIVLLCGGIGGLVHSVASFSLHMARRDFSKSWTWWYILRPFQGSIVAFAIYFVFAAGFAGQSDVKATNSPAELATLMTELYRAAAVAVLVGMFSAQSVEKLRQIADTVLAEPSAKSRPVSADTAKLTEIDPKATLAVAGVALTLKGSGLKAVKAVKVGTEIAAIDPAVARDDAQLKVTLDASKLAKGDHDVALDNKVSGVKLNVS